MYPSPRLVYWEVTKRCNLQCAHCRAMSRRCASSEELTTAEGLSFIDALAGIGQPLLVFTGGEPLLRGDLFVLARYAQRRGLSVALATNGTLVTSDIARRVAKTGFRRVSISLDGPDAVTHDAFRKVTGAFKRAMEGFLRLKELGLPLQVTTTVTAHNRERLDATYQLVRRLEPDAWHVFLFVWWGMASPSIAQLTPAENEALLSWIDALVDRETQRGGMEVRATCAPHIRRIHLQRQQAETQFPVEGGEESQAMGIHRSQPRPEPSSCDRRGCLAGTGICFVSHQGTVHPCGYLPVEAGDIRLQRFSTIWNEAAVFTDLRDPNRLCGKCGHCEYRLICGGCRARAFGQTGSYFHEEPFCNYLPASATS